MNLTLTRQPSADGATLGRLAIDGAAFCDTLEDEDRALERDPAAKIPGRSAIPRGRYPVRITWSPRFKRELPLLADVPGFSGVRIHPGNTAADTEGCILVGRIAPGANGLPAIQNSRWTFNRLFERIATAQDRGQPVTLDIV